MVLVLERVRRRAESGVSAAIARASGHDIHFVKRRHDGTVSQVVIKETLCPHQLLVRSKQRQIDVGQRHADGEAAADGRACSCAAFRPGQGELPGGRRVDHKRSIQVSAKVQRPLLVGRVCVIPGIKGILEEIGDLGRKRATVLGVQRIAIEVGNGCARRPREVGAGGRNLVGLPAGKRDGGRKGNAGESQ
jgi:hypothetical protein